MPTALASQAPRPPRRAATPFTRAGLYALSVGLVALAWALTSLLARHAAGGPPSLVLFFGAVAVSAGVGGLRPALLATGLSVPTCAFFFLPPFHSLAVDKSHDIVLLLMFLGLAVLVSGITGHLVTENIAAERRFNHLVNAIDGIVWEASAKDLRLTFVSQRAESLLGYPVDCWLNDPEFRARLVGAEESARLRTAYRAALSGEAPPALEYCARAAEGGEIWLRETVSVIADEAGKPVRLSGLCMDITERVLAAAKLQQFSRQLVAVQEAERRSIARELHDEIGQVLTGVKFSVEVAARQSPAPAGDTLKDTSVLLGTLMRRMSDLSLDLRPAMLDDLGLVPALEWQIDRFRAMTGIAVDFDRPEGLGRLPRELEVCGYRIVQEALTNVARHSGAARAMVVLRTEAQQLVAEVRDAGKGFDVPQSAATGGLMGMAERAALVGGTVEICSSPGEGTSVTARLPLNEYRDPKGAAAL